MTTAVERSDIASDAASWTTWCISSSICRAKLSLETIFWTRIILSSIVPNFSYCISWYQNIRAISEWTVSIKNQLYLSSTFKYPFWSPSSPTPPFLKIFLAMSTTNWKEIVQYYIKERVQNKCYMLNFLIQWTQQWNSLIPSKYTISPFSWIHPKWNNLHGKESLSIDFGILKIFSVYPAHKKT